MKIIGNLMIFVLVGLIFIQGFSFGKLTFFKFLSRAKMTCVIRKA